MRLFLSRASKALPCFASLASLLLGGALVLSPSAARADYVTIAGRPVTQGQMRVAAPDLERLEAESAGGGARPAEVPRPLDFILEETRVEAEISGVLARVRLLQVFRNPYPERLEALYVFPLPEDAAVDGYSFQIGETVVRGVVKEREAARREYEEARDRGRKAALLEEERQNVFSQSVANIPPGGRIHVRLQYAHPVKIDGASYLFRFPMVVAPRYIPGQALARPGVGRGWAQDTDQVPDASRLTPPVLPPGLRSGNDVFIEVKIDAAMPIQKVTPVTHELDITQPSPTAAFVQLRNASTIADKDFVLEYTLAGDEPVLASLTHRRAGSTEGYLALVLQPKRGITTSELAPREVILLLDTSGSMAGSSISQLRIFAQHILERLNPQDAFRIIAFDSGVHPFRKRPLEATPENIASGQEFVRRLGAGGGTEMLPALRHALTSGGGEEGRPRHLLLLTDALVGNDDAILAYLKRPELASVRVFPVAIGAAPNHYLMERAAEIGRGIALHVTNQDNALEMARRLSDKISTPYLTDLEMDWGGAKVRDITPSPLPDLYAGEPLVVLARYEAAGAARLTLTGNLAGTKVTTALDLDLPDEEPEHDALAPLWARRRIGQIWNRDLGSETAKGREEITRLGLEHQLVSRYTSFIAVEETLEAEVLGRLRSEQVPVLLPEGMTRQAAPAHAFAAPAPRFIAPSAPPQRAVPASRANPPSSHASNGSNGGNDSSAAGDPGPRGFGGAVEWVFLGALGLLGAGRALAGRRRRRRKA
jgi:Ca-activated chloride channel family protein